MRYQENGFNDEVTVLRHALYACDRIDAKLSVFEVLVRGLHDGLIANALQMLRLEVAGLKVQVAQARHLSSRKKES